MARMLTTTSSGFGRGSGRVSIFKLAAQGLPEVLTDAAERSYAGATDTVLFSNRAPSNEQRRAGSDGCGKTRLASLRSVNNSRVSDVYSEVIRRLKEGRQLQPWYASMG